MADRAEWEQVAEAELRALAGELDVPPAPDLTTVVRQRLAGTTARHSRRGRRPAWRAALGALATLLVVLVVLVATPQGRAVISHVLRFAGIELRLQPGTAPAPAPGSPPGSRPSPPSSPRA